MTDKYLSADDVAKQLEVSRRTVYRLIAKRNLPAHRKGCFWAFKKAEIDAWKKASKSTGAKHSRPSEEHGEQQPSATIQERFGFSHGLNSAHMARTMMLDELNQLLDSVPVTSPKEVYVQAIEEDNCLGKRSSQTRKLTKKHLVNLYTLDPDITLFHALRFFWQRDPEGHSLLASLCVYARDPLIRATAHLILSLAPGQAFSREIIEEHLENKYPGRFSASTLKSTAQNLGSTWTQTGHLKGYKKKSRTRVNATPGSTAYALLLGFLTGVRGELLFKTEYMKLLDCSFQQAVDLAEIASRKGWIVFKHIGKVIEVLFPSLLSEQEMGWIREQN